METRKKGDTVKKWTAKSEWNPLAHIFTAEQPQIIMVKKKPTKKTPA